MKKQSIHEPSQPGKAGQEPFLEHHGNLSGPESCFVFAFETKVSTILKIIKLSVNEAKLTGFVG